MLQSRVETDNLNNLTETIKNRNNNMKHHLTIMAAAAAVALAVSCAPKAATPDIIPFPNSLEMHSGTFNAAGAAFYCSGTDSLTDAAVNKFAKELSLASGAVSNVTTGSVGKGINFIHNSAMPEEAYLISVKRNNVDINASGLNGFIYAIQTLKQMLPVEIYGKAAAPEKDWTLPCLDINDAPRFRYRGMHLDVSRHFFSIDEVKKYIDMMSVHKMNTLHWHLTDDQGWRIEIKKYPRLTGVGSVRKGTVVRKEWGHYDGIPYGGFYTQEQIKDVIDYAAALGIDIIPEIDLPGHMLAALAAYPELGCTGGPYDVWGTWGIADDVLCAGNEKTMKFLEDVLSEVADLFPSGYVHIGGDECPKVRWEKCPVCQAKIKELGLKDSDEFNAEHYLQSYVMERMEKFLAGKGKKIIGWDEILEGTPGPDATIMSWRGSDGGIKASRMGHDVIMTPNSHFYFDYYQAKDIENEPFGIGGYIPVEKVYSYDPFTEITDPDARKHILGVQANVWTEYIASDEHLEYMILPRQAALSEVQWCQPSVKNWDRFLSSLTHEAAMYDMMGYNYAKTVFQVISKISVNHDKKCVEVALSTQGDAPIRYTVDGSVPDGSSPLYSGPIEVRGGCTVKAVVERDNMETRLYTQEFCDNKAMGKTVTLLTEPQGRYTFGAPDSFADGLRGNREYGSGNWSGWYKTPFSVTVDMGGETAYGSVTLGTLVDKPNDIFPPLNIVVSTSDNGTDFTEAGRIDIKVPSSKDADGIMDYTVTFPETSARYIRVDAETIVSKPAWHARGGAPGFLFVDEIIVK